MSDRIPWENPQSFDGWVAIDEDGELRTAILESADEARWWAMTHGPSWGGPHPAICRVLVTPIAGTVERVHQ